MKLGKLKTLGIDDLSEVALYLPTSYTDYSRVVTDFNVNQNPDLQAGESFTFKGKLYGDPVTSFKGGRPYTKVSITDGRVLLQFTLFGDARSEIEQIQLLSMQNTDFYVHGELYISSGVYINNAKIVNANIGEILPNYPGVPGKVKQQSARKLIQEHLDQSMPLAIERLRGILNSKFNSPSEIRKYLNAPGLTLQTILENVHRPTTLSDANTALGVLNRIAAIVAADELIECAKQASKKIPVPPLKGSDIAVLSARIPFPLTDEQSAIVLNAVQSITNGFKLDMLLCGDVGTGKTCVYGLIAAFICSAGGRCAIMLPNGNLSRQIHQELNEYFPQFNPLLISGDSEYADETLQSAQLLIGTTALLFKEIGLLQLAVFDESQKMAVEQQEKLTSTTTHKISVSATPIPRTMGLALYGAVKIAVITKCHAIKEIHTRLALPGEYSNSVAEVLWTILTANKQAMIICGRKEGDADTEDEEKSNLRSVEEVYEEFNQLLPGLVTMSHGGLSAEENAKAIESMKNGSKKLIIATTVLEIGITLPDLSYGLILDPQAHGLSSLHQLRGRIARAGGRGFFVMQLTRPIGNPKTIERLNILCNNNCGFLLAKKDLELRGIGDLRKGKSQHGAYMGLIKNVQVDLSTLEQVVEDLTHY